MSVVWNEPVLFLQRFTENVLYSYFLDRADESLLSSNIDRLSKPFNSLLSEIYDFVHKDNLPFRYTSEQVRHYPSISAFTCESKNNGDTWRFYENILPTAKFFC